MKWWVDAWLHAHPDMKGHTSGTILMGQGSLYSTSVKQKLVAQNSTESKLIRAHNVIPQIIWTQHFLKAKQHTYKDKVLYQGNMRAILLETNSCASNREHACHINSRHFLNQGSCWVKYPVHQTLFNGANGQEFFTKPFQGSLFRCLQDIIMNIDPSSAYHLVQRSAVLRNESITYDSEPRNES